MKKIYYYFLCFFIVSQPVLCCTIAVVSGTVSETGRPFIWKCRDYSLSPRVEVKYRKGKVKNGTEERIGSLRVVGESVLYSNFRVNTGGVNDFGFAIANDSVGEDNDLREFLNINHLFLQGALESCRNLADFENYIRGFNTTPFYVISGNFAVMDASGEAAMYELWTDGPGNKIMMQKYDANESELGVVVRANKHHTEGWVNECAGESCDIRYGRAVALFEKLLENNLLSPRTAMQVISKDVGGDCDKDNPGPECEKYHYEGDPESFDTSNAISRMTSTHSFVIDGAGTPEEILLITMFCSLGEPSFSPAVPYFLISKRVTCYARSETYNLFGYPIDLGVGSFLFNAAHGILVDGLYSNNFVMNYDCTINIKKLVELQKQIIPVENYIFEMTEACLNNLRENPEYLTPSNLYNLNHECAQFVYRYLNGIHSEKK